jgi:hypothetical protein
MPIHLRQDKNGYYFVWGTHGKKYHFKENNKQSIIIARNKAVKQAAAAYANGYKKK